jgi:very-short-patch-repair endonuclease
MDAPRRTRNFAKQLRREMSLPEVLLWLGLKAHRLEGLHFRKQHPIGPYVLDFYCDTLKLAVEVDGGWHDFGDQPRRDAVRDEWMFRQGIRTLRIPAFEVLESVDGALGAILSEARRYPLRPSGPPPPEGEDLARPDAPPLGELSPSD